MTMKKTLLTGAMLSLTVGFGVDAQTQKSAWNYGGVIPAISHHEAPTKGFVIFEEDFASGIPNDWTNVTVSGPVDWKYTTVGHVGDYPTPSIASTTSSNGWIIVDSDADNFSGGGNEDAQLTTPVIDCSGYTNVKVEFQQMFRRWQADITTVRVTTDGGANYSDFVLNSSITQAGTDNPDYVNIDITSAISGDPTNVQIVLWWQGAWDYGWQIDDFAIKEIDPNDILIKKTSLSEDVTYYQVPESQIQPLSFSAFGENIGFNVQTNVVLNVDVTNGGSSAFNNSSAAIALLASGASDSLYLTSTFLPSGIGVYDVSMNISQNEVDDVSSNNSADLNFEVTDTIYAIDNGVYAGQWYNLDDGSGIANAYEIGAVYEVVASDWASSASVFVGDNSTVGAVFEFNLYEYDAGSTSYVFIETTETYTVDNADLGNWVTTRFVNDVQLNAGSDYLLSVIYYGGPEYLYIGYGSNSSFTGATLSNDNDGSDWANQPRTPMIRLNLGEVGLSVKENDFDFNVYPVPANDFINIEANGANVQNVEIFDISGKLVSITSGSKGIDVTALNGGVYTVKVISDLGIATQTISIK